MLNYQRVKATNFWDVVGYDIVGCITNLVRDGCVQNFLRKRVQFMANSLRKIRSCTSQLMAGTHQLIGSPTHWIIIC